MTCEEVQEQLPGFVRLALEPEEARQVQDHLQGCEVCSLELESQLAIQQASSTWTVGKPSAGLKPRILAAVEQERKSWWRRFLETLERMAAYKPTPVTAMASVLLGLCLFGVVLAPNYHRARSEGAEAACRTHLQAVAERLEAPYPETVEALCPNTGEAYVYERTPQHYTLRCASDHLVQSK